MHPLQAEVLHDRGCPGAIPAAIGMPPPQARYQASGRPAEAARSVFPAGETQPDEYKAGCGGRDCGDRPCTPSGSDRNRTAVSQFRRCAGPGIANERFGRLFRHPFGSAEKEDRPPISSGRSLSENTREAPGTRSGKTCPLAREAQTRGMPSATTRTRRTSPASSVCGSRPGHIHVDRDDRSAGARGPRSRTTSVAPRSVSASNQSSPTRILGFPGLVVFGAVIRSRPGRWLKEDVRNSIYLSINGLDCHAISICPVGCPDAFRQAPGTAALRQRRLLPIHRCVGLVWRRGEAGGLAGGRPMTAPARGSGPRPALMAVEGAQISPSTIDIQRGGGSSAAGRQRSSRRAPRGGRRHLS